MSAAVSGLKIAIAGLGVVGSEVARQIIDRRDELAAAGGRPISIVAVNARNSAIDRGFSMEGIEWVDNAVELATRSDVDVIVEMIGGSDGVALDLARQSLAAGKGFVTANKAMLAHHGTELASIAEENNANLSFEAAVAGGIPAVKTLREGLAGNKINRVAGILNGTCNYILTTMEQSGRDFADVLADAQRLGYAEAEPSFDVDGIDAAHKLTILAAIAFGQRPDFDAVLIQGIREVSSVDFAFANQLGFRIKLVGFAEPGLTPNMQTCLLPLESQLAKVNGVLNAVEYHGAPVGAVLLVGPGAGGGATSSAVLSDLIDIAAGRYTLPFGKPVAALADARSIGNGDGPDRPYYVRLMVVDQPGVLASVTSVLQRFNISIEGLLQKGRAPNDVVALVMTTHETPVNSLYQALAEIENLSSVRAKPVAMPILPVDMGGLMEEESFLGISNSASGARWVNALTNIPEQTRDRMAAALGQVVIDLPLPVARIMADRGLTPETLDSYLDPKLRDLLPNPSRFKDLDKASSRLADAVEVGKPIGIFGDYDVDGAAAAALLVNVMRDLGVTCDVHIPDRFTEGYGPNISALTALQEKGAGLLVTVDCGITAHAPLAAVADTGMDVIVIDHHIAGPELPRAHSVVNPNRLDEDGKYGNLCAAAVVFIVLVATIRTLREKGHFTADRPAPNLIDQLDLVALATVCDVVPLTGLNRAFVLQGLKIMALRGHPGLAKLADVAGMNSKPNTHALGFLLGPRINAGGRIGASGLGVRLLSSISADEAVGLAVKLDELNRERRQIEESIRQVAIDRAQHSQDPVLILHDENWHEGVIGIVAGRIRERFGKPAIVIAFGENGLGKGSGRSIPGFRLGNAIIAAHQAGILVGGGGHDMAAGFTIQADRVAELQTFLNDRLRDDLNGVIPQIQHQASGLLSIAGCQAALADWIERLGPFGSGNAEPKFVITDCRIKSARFVGEAGAHISCTIDDGSGKLNGIAFQSGGTPLGTALLKAVEGHHIHILGRIRRDRFRGGQAVQLEIDDVALAL